ncbi:MAG: hypothetical protein RL477_2246, partial [Pseudomonadota bacterium]
GLALIIRIKNAYNSIEEDEIQKQDLAAENAEGDGRTTR